MISFRAAPSYDTIMTTSDYSMTIVDMAGICAHLEETRNDGYCVTAWYDGKLVADSEGPCNTGSQRCTDAATATGMYD